MANSIVGAAAASDARTLEQVLADLQDDAKVAKRLGHVHDAELLERAVREVKGAARTYLLWLNESEAKLWSGMSLRWLRAEYPKLEAIGFAITKDGRRLFRACGLPRRADLEAMREAGRQAGLADTTTADQKSAA